MRLLGSIWKRRTLRSITLMVASSSALLAVASLGAIHAVRHAVDLRGAQVLRGREVIAGAYALAESVSEVQTSRWMFLLTHDPQLLASYQRAVEQFRSGQGRLAGLVAGDEPQARRAAAVRDMFEVLTRTAVAEGGEPLTVPLTGDQRRAAISQMSQVDALQAVLDELVADQTARIEGDARAARQLGRLVDGMAVLAALLVASWGIAGIVLLSHEITRPLAELRAGAQAIARGELDRRVPVRHVDELGSLADSFNAMADQLQRQQQLAIALQELRELMHGVQDLDEVDRTLALLVPNCLPGTSGRLYLLDDAGDLMLPRGGWGTDAGASSFAPYACWAFRLGRPHEASAVRSTVSCQHRAPGGRGSICFPLRARGSVDGILEVTFAGAAPQGVTEIGETLALALANIRLREEMVAEAQHDPLTALFNRRHFDRAVRLEVTRAGQASGRLALALIDVDHFKRFNDAHGHAAGDAVLRELGATLKRTCRDGDVACRYGGEEFVVLLLGCGLDGALRKAEAIRGAVAAMTVREGGRVLEKVTVSIGVAAFPANGREPSELLAAADKALYRSKADGRDRVTAAPTGGRVVPADPA